LIIYILNGKVVEFNCSPSCELSEGRWKEMR